jgi:hypothetical protein
MHTRYAKAPPRIRTSSGRYGPQLKASTGSWWMVHHGGAVLPYLGAFVLLSHVLGAETLDRPPAGILQSGGVWSWGVRAPCPCPMPMQKKLPLPLLPKADVMNECPGRPPRRITAALRAAGALADPVPRSEPLLFPTVALHAAPAHPSPPLRLPLTPAVPPHLQKMRSVRCCCVHPARRVFRRRCLGSLPSRPRRRNQTAPSRTQA